jgi:hypothetical protein
LNNTGRHGWRLLRAGQACVAAWLGLVGWPALAQDASSVPARSPRLAIGSTPQHPRSPAFAQSSPNSPEETPSEEEQRISYGAEIALRSGHADRGFVISDRLVVQPVVWVSGSVAAFSLWSSFTLAETTDGARPQIQELELTLENEWKNLTIAPAVRMYFYHDPLSSYRTQSLEGWLYAWYDAGPLQLFTRQSVDVWTYAGAYFGEAGIESERRVSQRVEVGGSLGAGWASAAFNDAYADVDRFALDRVSVEGWLTFYVTTRGYITPHIEFSSIVDRRVRAELARPTFVFLGLTMGVEF